MTLVNEVGCVLSSIKAQPEAEAGSPRCCQARPHASPRHWLISI